MVVPTSESLKSAYGLGPAASKVYYRDRGLSIGGYGELLFNAQVADKMSQNIFDALRGVLYVGYKFNDWIVFNSEFEFEHAGTSGGGSASIEFMNVDFLLDDAANLRVGLVLIPVGFINELHEPTTFFGATRPLPEQLLIPTTWRENGAGLFGEVGEWFSYRMYAVNGLDATGFSNNGIRGGRQKGSRALADHWAFVLRTDFTPCDGLLFGASVYTGKSGQKIVIPDPDPMLAGFNVPDTRTTLWEVHSQYKAYGVSVRTLWVQVHLDDAAAARAAADSDDLARERRRLLR